MSVRSTVPGPFCTVVCRRGRCGDVEVEAAVGPGGGVVLHIGAEDLAQVGLIPDQDPVQALSPDGAHPAFGGGDRARRSGRDLQDLDAGGGERVEVRVNLVSRSRTRKRNLLVWSSRSISRLRAVWVTHAPVGCPVRPIRCTRRESTAMANRTYSLLRVTVSTLMKSIATLPAAWARRNSTQVGPLLLRRGAGPSPWRRRIVRTDDAGTVTPSLRASPTIRG
jgi:hypothetical protein